MKYAFNTRNTAPIQLVVFTPGKGGFGERRQFAEDIVAADWRCYLGVSLDLVGLQLRCREEGDVVAQGRHWRPGDWDMVPMDAV